MIGKIIEISSLKTFKTYGIGRLYGKPCTSPTHDDTYATYGSNAMSSEVEFKRPKFDVRERSPGMVA